MSNAEIIIEEIKELESRQMDYSTVQKLAWLYIVRDHLSAELPESVPGQSEFLKAVNGKDAEKVWQILDELMAALKIIQPGMYTETLHKLSDM